MKAKEYANAFKANPTKEFITKVLDEMTKEIVTISRDRHANSEAAIASVIREQDNKWRTFCDLIDMPELKPAFSTFQENLSPGIMKPVWTPAVRARNLKEISRSHSLRRDDDQV